MSHPSDRGYRESEPWTYRKRLVPMRTYSGRVVYDRHKHYFTVKDASRILAKLEPPSQGDGTTWAQEIIRVLRQATISMLQRILFFLPSETVNDLYQWSIEIMDRAFYGVQTDPARTRQMAINMIYDAARRAGIVVEIKAPES